MHGEWITTKSGHTALWAISRQSYLPGLWHDEISPFEWCYFRGKVRGEKNAPHFHTSYQGVIPTNELINMESIQYKSSIPELVNSRITTAAIQGYLYYDAIGFYRCCCGGHLNKNILDFDGLSNRSWSFDSLLVCNHLQCQRRGNLFSAIIDTSSREWRGYFKPSGKIEAFPSS
jgi:hypothetical protein